MADYGMTRNGSGYWDETPVQQDEVKGALPPSAQKQARECTSNVAPDGRINQAKPAKGVSA